MKISAIIPTCNRRDALEQCLHTLFDQDLPKDQYEIVVVVDGSTDGTAEMLRSLKPAVDLVIIEQANKGKSVALNVAVKAATGAIILIIDDDFLCDRAMLSAHLACHEPNSRRLVSGHMIAGSRAKSSLAERWLHDGIDSYYLQLAKDPKIRWPDVWAGPNASMARSVFLEAGGMDERDFPRRSEDSDLALRLWKMGVEFIYAPRAIATHRWIKSNRQFWEDCVEDGAAVQRLCRKFPEMRPLWGYAGLASTRKWKKIAARIFCSNLTITKMTVGAMGATSELLVRIGFAQKIAKRIFQVCMNIAGVAGAHREAGSWRALNGLYGRRLPVLLYHHIGAPTAWTRFHSLTVTPDKFRRQMRWLRRRGYVGITSSQWLAWCQEGKPLPEKPVLITFDDAYADIVTHAFPVLEEFGHAASVYVITELMREGKDWEGLPVISSSEMRKWAARGIEFGSHTQTHPDLTAESAEEIEREVKGSKVDLEAFGVVAASFAYPFGCLDGHVEQAVKEVFPVAFTCEEGINTLRTIPSLAKRTMVHPSDTLLDLELRLALGRSPLSDARQRLRLRSRVLNAWKRLLPRS